ncbi:response regulator [Brevibacillus formosus]|uniref:response regulator n=1 Tax=Brevibacillus TaxID=55080 RepID=UPI000D0ED2C0|nr:MULTISPECIES: response regulator [Brevibacillus]MBG9945840.1 transcriptional regulator [Brevibacillus formosus]MED1944093.1 response regulator [Brevibacillus formosus]MED1999535.1 response regulator [Brevibacillus formosus]MED2082328.1 response regulator [Brevibacillus formosus]PSK18759.1 transcriptional regulator [Brevibacillus sp. NRRL NRS-603]
MLFYLVDDDDAVRLMLTEIIEDENLGEVVGEASDGSMVDGHTLTARNVDILLIDLFMPNRDGIETIRQVKPTFTGKIVMISQAETKDLIAQAYALGSEYYIIKPVNKIEVVTILQKVIEKIRLERSIRDIHKSLNAVMQVDQPPSGQLRSSLGKPLREAGQFLLTELGIAGDNGSNDLLDILDFLHGYEQTHTFKNGFPALKEIFVAVAQERLGVAVDDPQIAKVVKASEQRVRRAIYQSLNHLASLGLADLSNWKFENYASQFFDFTYVWKKMAELKSNAASPSSDIRINMKKFIQVLYAEAKRIQSEA